MAYQDATSQPLELLADTEWFPALELWQQQLIMLSEDLYLREKGADKLLDDYSFIIFSMAKAYEGFLKDFFLKMNVINKHVYQSRRFRIGRALNPDVHQGQRDEMWLYDDVVRSCGQSTARQLWDTWLKCRNHVFHYFPGQANVLTLMQVRQRLDMIRDSIALASRCQLP